MAAFQIRQLLMKTSGFTSSLRFTPLCRLVRNLFDPATAFGGQDWRADQTPRWGRRRWDTAVAKGEQRHVAV
jgi:hypothetical protein